MHQAFVAVVVIDRMMQNPAVVDNWALSAGALLAYSCRYIGSVSESSMGAAEPVIVSSDGKMETASEKMVSALRKEFSSAASLYGRDPLIAEAMVDKDVLLVFRDGKVLQLLENSQILAEDTVINAKGKLLTLNSEQMKEFKISDFMVPELSNDASAFLPGEKLAQDPFFKEASIDWISYDNWKIKFFAFLSHPIVSSVLMMGLMLGIYSVIQGQGLGIAAGIGSVCLLFIVLSSFATHFIGWLEVSALFVGLFLIATDFWLLAGFGLLGALGLLLFLLGLIVILLPPLQGFSWNPSEWGIYMSEWIYRLSLFLFVILVFFVGICPWIGALFRRSKSFQKITLHEDPVEKEMSSPLPQIGSEGMSFSSLRPFGKVQIGDTLFEAQTEGEFLSSDRKIEVISIRGKILVVKEK